VADEGWFECERCGTESDEPKYVVPIALKPLEPNPLCREFGPCVSFTAGASIRVQAMLVRPAR